MMLVYVSNMLPAQQIRARRAIEVIAFCLSPPDRGEPGGSSLSFASPKESNQRKGDPQSGSLRATCGARTGRGHVQTRFAQTSTRPDPPNSPLLSPARTGFGEGFGFGEPSSLPSPSGRRSKSAECALGDRLPESVLQKPFCMRRGAQGEADQGERLSERSEFELDPALHEHRRLPVATAKGRRQQGRLFFCLLCFWRSKRKVSSRRATPGLVVKGAVIPVRNDRLARKQK